MAGALRREVVWEFDAQTKGMVTGLGNASRALDDLKDEAGKADKALRDIKDVNLDVQMDLNDLSVSRLRQRLQEEKRQLQARISDLSVDIDTTEALKDLKTIDRQLRQIDGMNAKADVKIDVSRDELDKVSTFTDNIMNLSRAMPLVASPVGMGVAGGITAIAAAAASFVGPAAMGGVVAALVGTGGGSLLYAYDKVMKGNTRVGEAFRELRKEAKKTAESVIKVTGKQLEDVVMKLNIQGAISKAFKGVDRWVKANGATLKDFFIDLAKVVVDGIKLFARFAEHALPAIGDAVVETLKVFGKAVTGFLDLTANAHDAQGEIFQNVADMLDMIPGMDGIADGFRHAGDEMRDNATHMREYADDNRQFIDDVDSAWGKFKSKILPAAIDGLRGLQKEADKWWRNLDKQGKDQALVLQVALEKGDRKEVEATLKGLSKKRLSKIVAQTDKNSDVKSERQLHNLARKRLAEIKANATTSDANGRLNDVATKERVATIGAMLGGSVERSRVQLNDIATKQRVATIGAQVGASLGNVRANLDGAASKRRTATINAVASNIQTAINSILNVANNYGKGYTATVRVGASAGSGAGSQVRPRSGRAFALDSTSRGAAVTSTYASTTALTSSGTGGTSPTVINVEVDGYRVARQVQRRMTTSGRVYV